MSDKQSTARGFSRTAAHYTVYGMWNSGNCYKVRLALEQLQLSYAWVEINSAGGETRNPEFLAKNPNGKVPLLELPDGKYLSESNAITIYLAEGGRLWPTDRWQRAQALQWMFFEQYSHEPYIAVARFIMKYLPADHPRRQELPQLHARGYQALGVMEKHLQQHRFFSGAAYGVADISLFAYTHCAEEGGFDLSAYQAVRDWFERVRAQPGFIALSSQATRFQVHA
ncbi:MAG: glutathione S-transferase family protein [Gammaproteobacteria bacterium]|nr:glutathione S-transferase family protein [Gammaproteobacteria bacterium]